MNKIDEGEGDMRSVNKRLKETKALCHSKAKTLEKRCAGKKSWEKVLGKGVLEMKWSPKTFQNFSGSTNHW